MELFYLNSNDIIDSESEIHFDFYTSMKNQLFPHYHDFFEIFLVLKGKLSLVASGKRTICEEGSLVFMRPNEIHSKEFLGVCHQINIAFPTTTVNALFDYLGEGFSKDLLLKPKYPPSILLSKTEKNIIHNKFEKLHTIPAFNKKITRMELRILLIEIFTRYFTLYYQNEKQNSAPVWLEKVLTEMKKKENFKRGMPALMELSGKNHAYICRMLNKYLNITPVEFINDLKLNYAANLLTHSDYDILTVSLESGFENLSHFYHLFKKKYGTAPSKYRNEYN